MILKNRSSSYPAYMSPELRFGMGFFVENHSLKSFSIFTWWKSPESLAHNEWHVLIGPDDGSRTANINFVTNSDGYPSILLRAGPSEETFTGTAKLNMGNWNYIGVTRDAKGI